MHLATLQLLPILGAEKSRTPFYIAGGVLVAWALFVSLGLGMRRPDFPGSQAGERVVVAISAALVLLTVAMAVVSSSTPAKATSAAATVPVTPRPLPPPRATTGAPVSPKATTGTPIPPSSPAARTAESVLMLAANPEGQLSFNTKQLSAKAGKVTIALTNKASLEHNVAVAQGSALLGSIPPFAGATKTLTLNLKPGTYTFYCSVPGHRQAGMEGTLSVS
jgi:plastocyanin